MSWARAVAAGLGRRAIALLLVGSVVAVVYGIVPHDPWGELAMYDGVVALSLLALLVGLRRLPRGAGRRAWAVIGVMLAAFLAGELLWWYSGMVGGDRYPSPGDGFFLFGYLPLAVGTIMLVASRERRPDRFAWLDSAALTAVALLAVWPLLIQPHVGDPEAGALETVASVTYVLADVLVLGVIVRLLGSRASRDASTWMLTGGLVLMFVADIAFAYAEVHQGGLAAGSWVDTVWLVSYLLIGFAPLHASARQPVTADEREASSSGRIRLVLAAVLLPQVAVYVELGRLGLLGANTLTAAVAVASAVMTLVSLRLWLLLGRVQRIEHDRGEHRLATLVDHLTDAVFLLDGEARITFASPAGTALLGEPVAELVGTSLLDRFETDTRAAIWHQLDNAMAMPSGAVVPLEGRLTDRDGRPWIVEGTACNLLGDDAIQAVVVTIRDVTARHELEQQLERRAFHDELTGLANRALFADRVAHALFRSRRRSGGYPAIFFVDLDDFKAVNDGMGHAAGDALLKGVADRIADCVRPGDTVARFGGDEFAILLEDVASPETAETVATRMLDVLSLPIDVLGISMAVPASIGIAFAGDDSTVDTLMRDADTAMYSAKSLGKGRVARFDDKLRDNAIERLQLKVELPQALARGELRLVYQPIWNVGDEQLKGFEALVRWDHPERGVVQPAQFVRAAEETGVIVDVGRWILNEACRQAVDWSDRAGRPLTMSVNVSGVQLHHQGFLDDLRGALERSGLAPSLLVVELTESVLVDHDAVQGVLTELRDIGVGIAIDDFGTGYSSLSYLQQFPVTSIKVDRSFVATLEERGDTGLVRSILSIAEALGLATVAEGVETNDQLEVLAALDCEYAQGYFLGRPATPAEIVELLDDPSRTARQ